MTKGELIPAKRGRPPVPREMLIAVCDLLAEGGNLRPSCEKVGIDPQTFYNRLNSDPELFEMYTRANEVRGAEHAEEALQVADQVRRGELPADAGRVVIAALQWTAGRRNRRELGEHQKVVLEAKRDPSAGIDLSGFTTDELMQFERLSAKATGGALSS